MQPLGRIVVTVLAFAVGYALTGGLLFSLFAAQTPWGFRTATGLACGLLVGAAVWRTTAGAGPGLGGAMMKGAGLLGAIGFAGGFFGPMLLTPESNEGPMLGIFITGPGGALLGAIAGAVWWGVRSGSGGASR